MKQFLASLMMLSLLSTADAGFVDEFSGGAPQQTWTFGGLPTNNYTSSYSALNGGFLQLGSGAAVGDGGAQAAFGFVAENFGPPGVIVRATLNPNGAALTRDIGVLAHLNPGQLNAYGLSIDFVGNSIDLSKITAGVSQNIIPAEEIPNFNPANSYDIELEVVGGNVTGRVYDSANNLLKTLQATDITSPYTSGFAGVVANRTTGDATLLGTFGRVSAAVPEPGGISLLMGMAMVLTSVRRRQRG